MRFSSVVIDSPSLFSGNKGDIAAVAQFMLSFHTLSKRKGSKPSWGLKRSWMLHQLLVALRFWMSPLSKLLVSKEL